MVINRVFFYYFTITNLALGYFLIFRRSALLTDSKSKMRMVTVHVSQRRLNTHPGCIYARSKQELLP
jgi:hypothetical protein